MCVHGSEFGHDCHHDIQTWVHTVYHTCYSVDDFLFIHKRFGSFQQLRRQSFQTWTHEMQVKLIHSLEKKLEQRAELGHDGLRVGVVKFCGSDTLFTEDNETRRSPEVLASLQSALFFNFWRFRPKFANAEISWISELRRTRSRPASGQPCQEETFCRKPAAACVLTQQNFQTSANFGFNVLWKPPQRHHARSSGGFILLLPAEQRKTNRVATWGHLKQKANAKKSPHRWPL